MNASLHGRSMRFGAVWHRAALLLAAALALGACGGSGSPSTDVTAASPGPLGADACDTASGAGCGQVLVALTDAEGDFVSYAVDVLSVTLERAGGASVELLPAATRIDFAELTELSDLLSVATLAPGDFARGRIRLDYSNADVLVEAGGEVVPASVVDADGKPLGVAELDIVLPDDGRLVVTRGRAAFLSLDFDLAAAHEVDTLATPPLVTARPYIVAEVAPVEEKELRLRGVLVDVDVASSSYVVDVRPWHARFGRHGRVRVHTHAATEFEISGSSYAGAAGLAALDALDAGTLTVAFGTLTTLDRRYVADVVHAGDSVGGERIDTVEGNVVARTGNTLTVKGGLVVRRDRDARAYRTITIDVGPGTRVLKTGNPSVALGDDAISVGQRIVAFGTFVEPTSAGELPVLDATAGRVRLAVTRLHGAVVTTQPGQLDLALRAIDRLSVAAFDFTGTGATPALDADPASYEVATATLGSSTLVPGESVGVLGFVRPFGSAPADFEGRTLIDRRALPAKLGISWTRPGTNAPFTTLGSAGLVLDLANPSIGRRHHLAVGARSVDLAELPVSPLVTAPAERGVFGIAVEGRIELFDDFGAFTDALARRLGAGGLLTSLSATGGYDPHEGTFVARRIVAYGAGAP